MKQIVYGLIRPSYLVLLGGVLCVGTVAATALAAPVSSVLALTADPGPCGATGVLASPTSCTYTVSGSDTFTVPVGVTAVDIVVVGAQGGHYFIAGDAAHGGSPAGDITGRPGGNGGRAAGSLTGLTPGKVLQVDVASRGANGTAASRSGGMMNGPSGGQGAIGGFGGSNGGVTGGAGDASGANGGTALGNGGSGSGGGGSSDVRSAAGGCAARTCALSDRVLVGGGGGGGGGTGGQGNAIGGAGGDGGGVTGADGGAMVDGGNAGVSGSGGTQTAGGAGGLNPGRHAAGANPNDPRYGGDGANGAAGSGGAGGAGNLPCTGTLDPPCSGGQNPTTSGGGAGGGAGGGYFGGGGGSGGGGLFGGAGGAGGGGAGGAAFASAAIISPSLTSGVNDGTINGGNGQISITWIAPTPTPSPTPSMLEGLADPVAHPLMNALSNVIKDGAGNKIIGLDPPCAMTGPYQGLSDIDKLEHSIQANDGCLQFITTFTGPGSVP